MLGFLRLRGIEGEPERNLVGAQGDQALVDAGDLIGDALGHVPDGLQALGGAGAKS